MIKRFQDISSSDVSTCGGKGASLGELMNAGFPFANGFVLTTEAFGKNHHEWKESVYKAFDNLETKYVAVRSSATKEDGLDDSFAGQFDTYLFVDRENLIEQIMACHDSIHSNRIIAYCDYKHIDIHDIKVAVVIQKMINSDLAGVAFTVNPVTNTANEVIIEAGYGLGEAVVSGMITPDNYVWGKGVKQILSKTISTQTKKLTLNLEIGGVKEESIESTIQSIQKLSDTHIQELAIWCTKIEEHYEKPMDIEWALEDGKLYILQARPITTLDMDKKDDTRKFHREDYLLAFQAQGVSVFVTDIHLQPFRDLEVLFIIDNGMFKQYFTKVAFEKSLSDGLVFYQDTNAFDEYALEMQDLCNQIKNFFSNDIKSQDHISQKTIERFFAYTSKLCGDYHKMNFEYTDKAFQFQDKNPIIQKNLSHVAVLKDQIRTVMNTVLFEEGGFCDLVFHKLAIQFDLPRDVFDNLTQAEILDLYSDRKIDTTKVRNRSQALVMHNDEQIIYENNDAREIIYLFRDTIDTTSNTIHGQIASRGIIRGKVKLISVDYQDLENMNREIENMETGDILVAETTAPELIIACKKAGAIITDMGGMMSHAAIISREFGIPCIVGTTYATQVLKEGDIVEVDADDGTIRILEKYEDTLKNTILERFNEPWIKRRAGSYTFLSCSYRGKQYYKSLQESLGVCFHQTLFTHRKGVVSFFVKKQEFETLGKTLAQRTQQHKNEAIARLEALKKNTDIIMDIMERYEGKILTLSEYKEFLEIFDKHLGYHNFMKKTVDFLSPELLDKMLPHFKEARIYSEAVYSRTEAFIRSLAAAIAEKEGGDAQLITCLTQEDLEQYIANGILPLPAVLQERFDASALFFDLGKEQVSCGNIVDEMENTIAGSLLSDSITGNPVYPGKVQGICRIVADPFHPGIFNKGDILVTGMTRPEYLPLVLKCAAFVTDAGGVLSHAAITARELQKPCIIGTEIATKILKNGELIEVDADNGQIKILSVD